MLLCVIQHSLIFNKKSSYFSNEYGVKVSSVSGLVLGNTTSAVSFDDVAAAANDDDDEILPHVDGSSE